MNAENMRKAAVAYHNAEKEFYTLRVDVKRDLLNAISRMEPGTRVDIEKIVAITGLTEKTIIHFVTRINSIELNYERKIRTYALVKEDGTIDTNITTSGTYTIPYIVKLDVPTESAQCTKAERAYVTTSVYYPEFGDGSEILRLLNL